MTAFNPGKPNVARIYDALRDGKDNFGPDRKAADAIRTMAADGQRAAHDNREFLARSVRFLIREQGVFQFLDIGSGLPADQNTHQIAHALSPRAHVAYIDNDQVVLGHARAVLEDHLTSIALPGDLRHPQEFLDDPDLRGFIDFGRPVAVMLLAVLHFIEDPLAYEVTRAVMREMPVGSCLVLSHASADQATPDEIKTVSQIYDQAPPSTCVPRTRSPRSSTASKSPFPALPTSKHGKTPPTGPPGQSATAAPHGKPPDPAGRNTSTRPKGRLHWGRPRSRNPKTAVDCHPREVGCGICRIPASCQ